MLYRLLSLLFLYLGFRYIRQFAFPYFRFSTNLVYVVSALLGLLILQDIFLHSTFSYGLKLVQVISFLPTIYLLFLFFFRSHRAFLSLFLLVLSTLYISVFRILFIGASSSGCLFCLSNYAYGMRSVLGLNLSGNACLALVLLLVITLDYYYRYFSFHLANLFTSVSFSLYWHARSF